MCNISYYYVFLYIFGRKSTGQSKNNSKTYTVIKVMTSGRFTRGAIRTHFRPKVTTLLIRRGSGKRY